MCVAVVVAIPLFGSTTKSVDKKCFSMERSFQLRFKQLLGFQKVMCVFRQIGICFCNLGLQVAFLFHKWAMRLKKPLGSVL